MVDMYVVCLPGVWYVLVWTRTRTSVGITCYLLLSPAQAVTLVTLQGYNQYRQSLVIQSDHILILYLGIIQTSQAKTRVYNIMKIKHLDLFFMKSNKEKNQIEQCKES